MNISELQKLDFLLKIINKVEGSFKYKLSFGFKGQAFIGDFVLNNTYLNPKTWNFKIKEIDVESLKSKHLSDINEIPFKYIEGSNDEWKAIWQNINSNLFRSELGKLFEASNKLDSYDYLKLLCEFLDIHFIIFDATLPSYIYNIKNLTTQLPINFIKVDENTEFDFISLIPEESL